MAHLPPAAPCDAPTVPALQLTLCLAGIGSRADVGGSEEEEEEEEEEEDVQQQLLQRASLQSPRIMAEELQRQSALYANAFASALYLLLIADW